jgi:flagellar protein FlaG
MEISLNRIDAVQASHRHVQPSPEFRDEVWEIVRTVKKINELELSGTRSELTIVVDPQTRRLKVRIIDKETGDVLRQIPPESLLEIARNR